MPISPFSDFDLSDGLQEALRRVGEFAEGDNDPAVARVGRTLIAFADGKLGGVTLDAALGLSSRFAADNARLRRTALIRELAARHFNAETKRGRAGSILSALAIFRDRHFRPGEANHYPENSRERLLWEILAAHEHLPEPLPSARTIREILAAAANGFRPTL